MQTQRKKRNINKNTANCERDRKHFFTMYDNIDVVEKHCNRLTNNGIIDKYALILHDQDVYPIDHEKTGQLKEPHIHIFIRFHQPKSLNRGRELMKISEQNFFSEFVVSTIKSIRYLCHLDDNNKHQYQLDAIRSNFNVDKYYGRNRDTTNSNLAQACIDLSNDVPIIEIINKYGCEFIKNYSNISKIALAIKEQKK